MSGNVVDIFTGEVVDEGVASVAVRPEVDQILAILTQRKNHIGDILVVWTEVSTPGSPLVTSTPMDIVSVLGLAEYVKTVMGTFEDEDEE